MQEGAIDGRQTAEGFGLASVFQGQGPACQFLARSTYVQAVCWVGACLVASGVALLAR